MFKENNSHLQTTLFDVTANWHKKYEKLYENSWAKIFYHEVFCKIDEEIFKPLYSDIGRPNAPINVLVSLELIKHLFNYTDEELVENYHFHVLVRAAIGIRDFHTAPPVGVRAIYNFRSRLSNYMKENPKEGDLIAELFHDLTGQFIKRAGIKTREQRVDSTQIASNIKRVGRLSLGYDVLHKAVTALPVDILPEELSRIIEPEFQKDFLYKSSSDDAKAKLQTVLELCAKTVEVAENNGFGQLEAILLVKRFLEEQASFDLETGTWIVKDNKELNSDCLQSAHDPDATFIKKGAEEYVGFVANISETCHDDNPVQLITDYSVEKNNVHDTKLLADRIEAIKETGAEEIYLDGGYYSEDTLNKAEEEEITLNFTNMTGTAPNPDKLPITDFEIEDNVIKSCPMGKKPVVSYHDAETGKITAHFDLRECRKCEHHENCPSRKGRKSGIVVITPKALAAAQTRKSIKENRKLNTSKRAAIEGTNSALKRTGANELRVRTLIKTRIVFGLKVISRNIRQLWRYFAGDFRRKRIRGSSVQKQALAIA